jgi:serine phosphatase RsbU (regulator of sigma subunit)
MVTSLRFWLIASFSIVLIICLVAIFLFVNALNQSKQIETYHSYLKTTRILLLETNKLKEDILISDLKDSSFYNSNNSDAEIRFNHLNKRTTYYIENIEKSSITKNYQLEWKIKDLKKNISDYKAAYRELIYLYKLKGFKDYGLEGKMREYAHMIYNFPNKTVQYYCLVLRKHEKDFLLRKDLNYLHQFDMVTKVFIEMINKAEDLTLREKNFLLNNLYYYSKNFKMLVRIESKIGILNQVGYLETSREIFDKMALLIEDMDNELMMIKEDHKRKLRRDTIILVTILIVFLVLTIIFLTQLITKSVKSISSSFTKYINSGFNIDSVSYKRSKIKEFHLIYVSFLKMAKEIHVFTNFFREKVHERTVAINQQKDEILAQQLQIENQYKILLTKNVELNSQKQLLALKNREVQESLRYAKRIQEALQPSKNKLKECFSDSFIYSKAKDVVSGDFYLVYRTSKTEGFSTDRTVFITSDCTGHGVPGAIMSVLGINTLYKNIKELKNNDPAHILNSLDKDLNQVLAHDKQGDAIVADGMDIGVFSFDKDSYVLDYSIAKFSQILVRDSEIIELETQKSSIGYSFFENEKKKFVTSSIQLKEGDCLYLFSDGLQDQFGGPLNKKYKKNNIKELVKCIHSLPMKEQKILVKKEFAAWKQKLPQTDDVLMMGVRF